MAYEIERIIDQENKRTRERVRGARDKRTATVGSSLQMRFEHQ